jgi:2-keto-4-pentenoate hydratase
MSLNDADIVAAATLFRAAKVDGRQVDAISIRHPDAEIRDGYSIQAAWMRLRVDQGDPLYGYKVGLTGSQLQDVYGTDEPVFGHLHASAFGSPLLIEPFLETEVAFVLGQGLDTEAVTIDQVLAAAASVMPAFEIIDSRVHNRPKGAVDLVADNGAAAQAFLAPRSMRGVEVDLSDLAVELRQDGKVIEAGSTARVLGHPARAVAWLAGALARQGRGLRPGEVVLSGTCTTPVPYRRSSKYEADFGPLGWVRLDAEK